MQAVGKLSPPLDRYNCELSFGSAVRWVAIEDKLNSCHAYLGMAWVPQSRNIKETDLVSL